MVGELTTRQAEIRDELLHVDPVPFDAADVKSLRIRVKEEMLALSARLAGTRLHVAKTILGHVHSCEARADAARQDDFEPSLPWLRGRVAHRAIEQLILAEADIAPLTAVRSAIATLAASEDRVQALLDGLSDAGHHDFVRDSLDPVAKWHTDWPPIDPARNPRVESRASLAYGTVGLSAVPDLVVGLPTGGRAGSVVIDFKTGAARSGHRADSHWYALVETLRSASPPARVATYYLDSGTWVCDDVDHALLETAARRALDGTRLLVEIIEGRAATTRSGPACRWCPLRDDCDTGAAWLAEQNDDGPSGSNGW